MSPPSLTVCACGVRCACAQMIATLRVELDEERQLRRALVVTLPRCDVHPLRAATRSRGRGGARLCDECRADEAGIVPEYPRAEPLRMIALHEIRLAAREAREEAREERERERERKT
jgi:hypothetical protein